MFCRHHPPPHVRMFCLRLCACCASFAAVHATVLLEDCARVPPPPPTAARVNAFLEDCAHVLPPPPPATHVVMVFLKTACMFCLGRRCLRSSPFCFFVGAGYHRDVRPLQIQRARSAAVVVRQPVAGRWHLIGCKKRQKKFLLRWQTAGGFVPTWF